MIVFFIGFTRIIVRFYHLIMVFIRIEFIIIGILISFIYLFQGDLNYLVFYIFFRFLVGDGCLSLGILVGYIRHHNLDFLVNYNIRKL